MGDEPVEAEKPAHVDPAKWYVHVGENDVRGPCDADALKSLLESAFIDGCTNVWCDGMESWQPISACRELKQLLIESDKGSEGEGDGAGAQAEPTPEDEARKRKKEKKKQYLKRKKQRIESGQWVDSTKNYSVYVSGLPKDTTLEEVAEVFKRAGLIKIDPLTTLPKIKLYTDENGELKRDGTVTFVNKESIDFALRYLDNYHFRENCVIHVERAKFEPRDSQQRQLPPSAKAERRKKYLAAKYEQERLKSWSDMADDGTGRRIVISKPMFSMEDAMRYEAGDQFYRDLKEEILAEVSKYVEVEKVTPIARHPQGVVCIKFKNSSDAELFISRFNNRLFDGRQLEVYFFDGKTDLQAQTIPSRVQQRPQTEPDPSESDFKCDWIEEQSSDEEFEIKTE